MLAVGQLTQRAALIGFVFTREIHAGAPADAVYQFVAVFAPHTSQIGIGISTVQSAFSAMGRAFDTHAIRMLKVSWPTTSKTNLRYIYIFRNKEIIRLEIS